MATNLSHQAIEIKRKQRFAKRISPNEDMKREICEQIEICEQLGRPVSETQISEWVNLTINSMLCRVHSHKFA